MPARTAAENLSTFPKSGADYGAAEPSRHDGAGVISPHAGEKAFSCICERACPRASAWKTQERGLPHAYAAPPYSPISTVAVVLLAQVTQQVAQGWLRSGPTPQNVPASPLTHAAQQIVSPASQVIGTDFFMPFSMR